jgi:hypothetical protein
MDTKSLTITEFPILPTPPVPGERQHFLGVYLLSISISILSIGSIGGIGSADFYTICESDTWALAPGCGGGRAGAI